MRGEPLIMACCSDIAGQVRGKAFPARDLEKRCANGVGWCPTNVQITAFNQIADTPFGSLGDALLMPDPAARVDVDLGPDDPGEHLVLGDIVETDGVTPWPCCLRSLLKGALAALSSEAGLELRASFEHEFHYAGPGSEGAGGGFGLRSFRAASGFHEQFAGALDQAGIAVDLIQPEYGLSQHEISIAPRPGLAAADQAVILRELARAVARRQGVRVTFAPIVAGMGVGNGVHVHLGLVDREGRPVMYDPKGAGGLSATTGSFVAGILRHLPALVAFTAASTVSYQRLVPHRWSSSFNNLGYRDREAAVRICPVRENGDVAAQYHVEYRAADAVASPYLLLAMVAMAGLQGLREKLPTPRPTEGDLATMSAAELEAQGVERLPTSLPLALAALDADATAKGWLPPLLLDCYRKHKQGEIAALAGLSETEQAVRYTEVY
jgi:glutamine synthetase